MRNLFLCRRTFITTLGIACLTSLGVLHGADVAWAIAGCVGAICGANAAEASMKHKHK